MAADYERAALHALRINPRDREAWNRWGIGLFNEALTLPNEDALPMLADAARKYAVASDLAPSEPAYLRNGGNALFHQGTRTSGDGDALAFFAGACEKYRAVVRLTPRDHVAWDSWGAALVETAAREKASGDAPIWHEACVRFAVAADLAPDKWAYWNNWGVALQKQTEAAGDDAPLYLFREAGEKYDRATRAKPEAAATWRNWGMLLLNYGRLLPGADGTDAFAESHEKFAQSARIEPDNAPLLLQWGALYTQRIKRAADETAAAGFYSAGVACYAKAAELTPADHVVWNDWGVLLVNFGDRLRDDSEAVAYFLEAREKYRVAESIAARPIAASNTAAVLIKRARRGADSVEEVDGLLREARSKAETATERAPELFYGWLNLSGVCIEQAKRAVDAGERTRLFAEAREKHAAVEQRKPGGGACGLAAIAALTGDFDVCRAELERGAAAKTITRTSRIERDPDFDAMRGEGWFVALCEGLADL